MTPPSEAVNRTPNELGASGETAGAGTWTTLPGMRRNASGDGPSSALTQSVTATGTVQHKKVRSYSSMHISYM